MKPVAFAVIVLSASLCSADVKLPAIISDHMVMQAGKPVPIWGWADAGEQVTVSVNGQTKSATPGDGGKWMVTFEPMKADAKPTTLTVKGKNTITVNDVLVGEVWLGSGQSNMAFTVKGANNFEQEAAAANYPAMRHFRETSATSAKPSDQPAGKWETCRPDNVGGFSAALYFMGRDLHKQLGVPVGLINSSVGGTPIEAWVRADAQHATPELKGFFDLRGRTMSDADKEKATKAYEAAMVKWRADAKAAKAAGKTASKAPRNAATTAARKGDVGGLFNGKISPLIPYAVRGVIWYQGEANTPPEKGPYYRYQLPLLVTDWRSLWHDDKLPFAWVQLPNFAGVGRNISLVREAMLMTLKLPNTGMAIAIDVGETKNIHPKNKQAVGARLATWALSTVYGKGGPSIGPTPAGHEVSGSAIVVHFNHADGGLKTSDGAAPLAFELAGADKKFHPAEAKLAGDTATVTSSAVPQPVALRYAWANDPKVNLYNGAGLPASPFRTDDWEQAAPE